MAEQAVPHQDFDLVRRMRQEIAPHRVHADLKENRDHHPDGQALQRHHPVMDDYFVKNDLRRKRDHQAQALKNECRHKDFKKIDAVTKRLAKTPEEDVRSLRNTYTLPRLLHTHSTLHALSIAQPRMPCLPKHHGQRAENR